MAGASRVNIKMIFCVVCAMHVSIYKTVYIDSRFIIYFNYASAWYMYSNVFNSNESISNKSCQYQMTSIYVNLIAPIWSVRHPSSWPPKKIKYTCGGMKAMFVYYSWMRVNNKQRQRRIDLRPCQRRKYFCWYCSFIYLSNIHIYLIESI